MSNTTSTNAEAAAVVYFSRALNLWVTPGGAPVCQDHAHVVPCPYPGRCPTDY